ncbi:MAG TPA: Flp pilus assembly protein CpaB [Solimonas sp.]|nr:Flp pilus assembly protein CpaB [Solimonas sp.]
MSSSALKIVAAVAVVLALLLAVLGYNVSRNYAEKAQAAEVQTQTQAAQTLVVVALKPLAAYKPIERDDVRLVPTTVVPSNPYTNVEDVVKKVPLVDIDAGAPVTQRYFKEGNVLARIIPAGYQAVSVEVNDVTAVGGFVRPGDIVDVLLYLRGGGGVEQAQSRVLLEQVRVLAYEERIIDRPEGIKEDEEQRKRTRTRTAVLAIPDKDTTKLMLGVSLGELRLALRSQIATGEGEGADATATPGLPLSPEAQAAAAAKRIPDKAISAEELARIKPPPADARQAPPKPRVEVIRGSQRETVTTRE